MAESERKDKATLQLVSFMLGNELYGIDILCVQEIVRLARITRVPNAPEFVEGVVNLRGHVIPVVDLRKRLGLPEAKRGDRARIIFTDLGGQLVGFIVDSVEQVLRIPSATIDPPPAMSSAPGTEFVKGIGRLDADRLIVLLDFEKVLAEKERADLKTVT